MKNIPTFQQQLLKKFATSKRSMPIWTRLGDFQKICTFALAALMLILNIDCLAQEAAQLNLARTVIQAGMFQIDAQVAQTPQEREIGLMFRREMPMHEGMIFVFDRPATQCFWMKNTLLPLSAAFIAEDGTIVNLADMKAQSTDSHCSDKEVRFVLEMHQGWFAKRSIKAGYKLAGAIFGSKP